MEPEPRNQRQRRVQKRFSWQKALPGKLIALFVLVGSSSKALCVYIYIYMHIFMYIHTYIYIYTYINVYLYVERERDIYIYLYRTDIRSLQRKREVPWLAKLGPE